MPVLLSLLLAIRDCCLDNLRDHASSLPPGLMSVLARALTRSPNGAFEPGEHVDPAHVSYLVRGTPHNPEPIACSR